MDNLATNASFPGAQPQARLLAKTGKDYHGE
jgi:hypothetical protein